jgi:hypothetical protein
MLLRALRESCFYQKEFNMRVLALTIGAISLVSAPVLAQQAPTLAPIESESELGGEGGAGIIAAALIAGIAAMGVLAFADDDDDVPVSP